MNTIQQQIQQMLDDAVNQGIERGIQVAVYCDGQMIVDAWAGVADAATGKPVDAGTLFPVYSTTKGLVATVIHMLAERGKLRYDDRIADHWPQFAAHGKEQATIRHALTHTAGVALLPETLTHADVCDWDRMCEIVADLEPQSAPGTRMEYHALTYGWILGEVVRRIDGRTISQIVKEDICKPLGIEDQMYIGIDDEAAPRVAMLEEPDPAPVLPHNARPQSVPDSLRPMHEWLNRPDARRAAIPAGNGILNARALARHYAALLPGGVDGIELLPPPRVRLAAELQHMSGVKDEDLPMRMGLGYGALSAINESLAGGWTTAFGTGGYGGSIGFADHKTGIAFGLTKNLFTKQGITFAITERLWEIVKAR
jgi:CubicO group peptidase (beta-lactamase class C family)